jgi:hypothetical protein
MTELLDCVRDGARADRVYRVDRRPRCQAHARSRGRRCAMPAVPGVSV